MCAAKRSLRAELHAELERYGLVDVDTTVLVAVSGGLDSVTLLHVLCFSATRPRLVAAHFDHRMRADSARDAEWVRGLCQAWSVPLVGGVATTPPRSEADARAQRYAFLERTADETGARWIVTGHHADDQAETVLFRLARGTGLPGLAGVVARRGRIVRPLLRFQRAELRAYAHACGITWREDPTNRDTGFARNWIRARVLPALEAMSPGATARIAALARRAAEAEAGWNTVVREAVQNVVAHRDESTLALARDRLLAYHPHIRARVIRQLVRELGGSPGRAGTGVALRFVSSGASGAQVQLAGNVTLSREFDRLLLRRSPSATALPDLPLSISAAAPGAGSFRIGGHSYRAVWNQISEREWPQPATASAMTASFDPAALSFPLLLRGWQPGDRIRLPYGSKKLKELFREKRIGRARRGQVPVLQAADGRILWVAGAARARETEQRDHDRFEISVMDGATS